MTRQEGDLAATDVREEEGVRRRAKLRVDLDLEDVVEEGLEARSAEHADLSQVLTRHARASSRRGGDAAGRIVRRSAAILARIDPPNGPPIPLR
jgi:hypothetical protein